MVATIIPGLYGYVDVCSSPVVTEAEIEGLTGQLRLQNDCAVRRTAAPHTFRRLARFKQKRAMARLRAKAPA